MENAPVRSSRFQSSRCGVDSRKDVAGSRVGAGPIRFGVWGLGVEDVDERSVCRGHDRYCIDWEIGRGDSLAWRLGVKVCKVSVQAGGGGELVVLVLGFLVRNEELLGAVFEQFYPSC
jgi:hypothetical protein